jgi:hypothetical protein
VIPPGLDILVDTRERKPLLFPATTLWHEHRSGKPQLVSLEAVRREMWAGDYAIDGHEDTVLIERKGSLQELHGNFFSRDYRRAQAAFQKLIEATENAYLLLDITPSEMWTPTEYVPEPIRVFDALCGTIQKFGLRLVYAGHCKKPPARRKLGEQLVHLMAAHCFRGITPDMPTNQELMDLISGEEP